MRATRKDARALTHAEELLHSLPATPLPLHPSLPSPPLCRRSRSARRSPRKADYLESAKDFEFTIEEQKAIEALSAGGRKSSPSPAPRGREGASPATPSRAAGGKRAQSKSVRTPARAAAPTSTDSESVVVLSSEEEGQGGAPGRLPPDAKRQRFPPPAEGAGSPERPAALEGAPGNGAMEAPLRAPAAAQDAASDGAGASDGAEDSSARASPAPGGGAAQETSDAPAPAGAEPHNNLAIVRR